LTFSRPRKLLALAALALVLTAVALADHEYKGTRMHRADVAWWYCVNRSVGCGSDPERLEHRADGIERSWTRRERVYTVLLGMVLGAALAVGLGERGRRGALTEPSVG
jgi:hypothetical protein